MNTFAKIWYGNIVVISLRKIISWFEPQYSWVLLQRDPIWHHMKYITTVTETEYKSQFLPTKYTPYLTLMGESWGVFCKDFEENWPRYNGTALYWN